MSDTELEENDQDLEEENGSEELETEKPDPDSILASIKQMLGIDYMDSAFDFEIITNINTVFMSLYQLGFGPEEGFRISGNDDLWASYLFENLDIEAVKTYIYLKVRLLFDPPSTSFVIDALERQINELEWRLNIQFEKKGGSM